MLVYQRVVDDDMELTTGEIGFVTMQHMVI